jgi:hypothetical protein
VIFLNAQKTRDRILLWSYLTITPHDHLTTMAKAMRPMSVDSAHTDATVTIEPIKKAKRPHSPGPRPLWVDALVFFLPMVFHGWLTDCRALMLIGCIRVVVMQLMLTAHWVLVVRE